MCSPQLELVAVQRSLVEDGFTGVLTLLKVPAGGRRSPRVRSLTSNTLNNWTCCVGFPSCVRPVEAVDYSL